MTEAERKDFKEQIKERILKLEGESPIVLGQGINDDYFPMDDYKANNYKPMGPRKCHFCRACIDYYKELHERGVTKQDFLPRCTGDYRLTNRYIDKVEFNQEEIDYIEVLNDPVAWAKYEFDWDARWYQAEIARCSSQLKAIRAGRRIGKTAVMSILSLWKLFTNGGLEDRAFELLVLAPYQPQVAKIFDNLRDLIRRAQTLSMPGIIKRDVQNPQLIQFAEGGIARGWSSGSHSGAKSDKVRGQDADMIVMDEVDYIADGDIEVIMAILASHPSCELIVSSTPTGLRKKLHTWSTDKSQRFKEFWYISSESPSWNADVEHMFRQNYSESGYQREFLAEFGEEMEGVFKASDINAALADYNMEQCIPHSQNQYVIGVDWNKNTGTHIVVVEALNPEGIGFKYRIVDIVVIRKDDFTQHAAVEKIVEMDKKWNHSKEGFIYVDAGYGDVQVEMLWKMDVDNPTANTRYRERVKPIQMGQKIDILDPVSGEPIKKNLKQLMVNTSERALQNNQVILPLSEDTTTRIVPDELPFSRIGVVQQARDFRITRYSPTGIPAYSQDYEHTLTAWMLAIFGHFMEYSDVAKREYSAEMSYSGGMGTEHGKKPGEIGLDLVKARDLSQAKETAKEQSDHFRAPSRTMEEDGIVTQVRDAGSSIAAHILSSGRRKSSGRRGFDGESGGSSRRSYKPRRSSF